MGEIMKNIENMIKEISLKKLNIVNTCRLFNIFSKLNKDDSVISALIIRNDTDMLAIISEKGLGKKFKLSELLAIYKPEQLNAFLREYMNTDLEENNLLYENIDKNE